MCRSPARDEVLVRASSVNPADWHTIRGELVLLRPMGLGGIRRPSSGEQRYDLVLQLGGTYRPQQVRRVLTEHGTLVQSYGDGGRWVGPMGSITAALARNPIVSQTLRTFLADEHTATLDELRAMIDTGHLRPVVGASYPLAETAAAVAPLERGRPVGKIVITVA